MTEYDSLYSAIVLRLDGGKLLPPSITKIDQDAQRVSVAVCDATGMLPAKWDAMSPAERTPWLRRTLAVMSDQETERPMVKPQKRGRKANREADMKIANEYWQGRRDGKWTSQAEYLRLRQLRKVEDVGQKAAAAWLSALLKRAKSSKQ